MAAATSTPTRRRSGVFIGGDGNVGLYAEARVALAAAHERHRPRMALDVGCGDGRLTVAALPSGLARLDLVEPAAELLDAARARITGKDESVAVVPHGQTAQAFLDSAGDERWDLAQSTFALHALPPEDRCRLLGFLVERVRRLLVVEFDVPAFADRSDAHAAAYAAARYELGVAEYLDDDLVVDGFLLPALVGQFDPARPRLTWEQPAAAWADDRRAAGFAEVRDRKLADYWWAPADLLEATTPPGSG